MKEAVYSFESLVLNHQARCCHKETYENMAIHLYENMETQTVKRLEMYV
jgi:hypothetical protein